MGLRVTVGLRGVGGMAELSVTDDGDGIPPEQHDLIFERFTRLDGARTRDAGGTGLGLAITQGIAVKHGGRVYVDARFAGGARFVFELPLAR